MRTLSLTPGAALALGLWHDDTLVRPVETPGPARDRPVELSLWVRADAGVRHAMLRCAPDGEEELHAMRAVETRGRHQRWVVTIRPRVARLRYRFRLELPSSVAHLTMAGVRAIDPVDAFDFTLLLDGSAPEWPVDAVLYQIFPDRFAEGDPTCHVPDGKWSLRGRSTMARRFGDPPLPWSEAGNLDFYGGDLAGIEQRLGHLAALGVTGLFLNPIWPALSNHRYDLVDNARVDPHLGGDAALASLGRALRERDMRLVLDVVLNHTGSGHPWFGRDAIGDGKHGAFVDEKSPYRDHYLFDEWPNGYRSWLGFDTLPRLDLASPSVREALWAGEAGALRKFLRAPFLVDGYRFDVANMMGRDGAAQHHRALWTELRASLRDEREDVYLVGEHFFDPDKLLKGDGLDGVMAYHAFTFPLRTWLCREDRKGAPSSLDAAALAELWAEAWGRVGWPSVRRSSLHVNTHDLPRLQTLGERARPGAGGRLLDVATALQLALPGVPCLYYGDEVGLEGGADPDNRRCMEWDEARWDRGRLERTRAAVAARRDSPALRRGGFVDLGSRGDVLAFARPLGDGATVIVASRADEPLRVALDVSGLVAAKGRERIEVEVGALEVARVEL